MKPLVQIVDPGIEIGLVGFPRQSIHTGRGVFLQSEEGRAQHSGIKVVEERRELFLLSLLCYVPYARQRL